MTRHLSDEMAVDLALGALPDASQAHLANCVDCGRKIEEMRETLDAVRADRMDEPSAEYFVAFRRHLGRRIAESAEGRWRPLLWLPALAVAGAMALVLALAVGPGEGPRPSASLLPAWTPASADEGLAFTAVRGLEPTPEDVAVATGQLGIANEVAGLSDDESADLAQAVKTEIRSGAL
jgi:hypothetical protein